MTIAPDDDLNTAMRRFTELNLDELPVLATSDRCKLMGMLRRKDVISVYNRQLLTRREDDLKHN